MKTITVIVSLSIGLFAASFAAAQGTVYLSNVNQSSAGSAIVASNSWYAESFETGTNFSGYSLNSVQLLLRAASGNPNGFTASIYSLNNYYPDSNIGILVGSINPFAGGLFNYTASNILLSPSTYYFIVLQATTSSTIGYYNWSFVNNLNYNSSDGWIQGPYYMMSADSGVTWSRGGGGFQFAITAIAVPEPSVGWLAGLVLLCISFWRRQNR